MTRRTMSLDAALLAVVLASLSASQAEPAANGLWDYHIQLTRDKDSMEHTQSTKLGRDTKNLKESIQERGSYMGNFLEKLAPFSGGLQPQLYQDSDGLRRLIRKELEGLRMKLSPYVDDVHQRIGKNLEMLRFQLQPFTAELLDQVSLKARELRQHLTPSQDLKAQLLEGTDEVQRFVAQYANKIAFHTDQVKEIFHPFADKLIAEIHRNLEELHRNVVPHTKASSEKVDQYIQELSEKLTQNARGLHQKIQRNLNHLKEQLSLYPGDLREPFASSPADPRWVAEPYVEGLAREVQMRVEEFRRDTFLQIEDFTRTIARETEDLTFKLSSPSPSAEEFQDSLAPIEDLHIRLDSLWKDISQSLNEKSSDFE
ncbi:PREDICTED: apolipoprotein A-V [Crocodylus porosus]|uniref:apolipoprotein A-V n=1 Tax=Crocodylus porosus TaxID=8502 RepID=UPI00093EA89A|nr:PREDICTED: apolipoprotein A-V [Crocodylus porosus]XP_019398650.1 PREDICTED: apolipoprotein A-V [Crocodylus porosus]